MESIHWKIYCLVDPRTGIPRYVGKTTQGLRRRLLRHLEEIGNPRYAHVYKVKWLTKLKNLNLEPEIRLLEEGLGEGWVEAERKWIAEFREKYGENMTNTTDGGDGALGTTHTEEARRKISEKNRGRKHSIEARKKMSETRKGRKIKPFTKEHLENLSKAHKGYRHTEEWKRRHAEIMTGKILGPNSPEAIRNQRLSRIMRKYQVSAEVAVTFPEYFTTPEMIELAIARNSGSQSAAARELNVPVNLIRYYDPRKKLNVR